MADDDLGLVPEPKVTTHVKLPGMSISADHPDADLGLTPDSDLGLQPSPTTLGEKAMTGLKGATKGLDYLAGLVRAAVAKGGEALTGKTLFSKDELMQAMSPTNTQRFPDSAELLKRAGVPRGASLSDAATSPYAPSELKAIASLYAKPGSSHPWYQPEIGGKLDPTVRGAGGLAADMALDPLSWASLGSSAAAKRAALLESSTAIAQPASRGALRDAASAVSRGADQVGNVLTMPAQAVSGSLNQAAKLPVIGRAASAVQGVATAPSDIVRSLSKKVYRSGVKPIALAGQRYGNPGVVDTMLDAGIHGNPPAIKAGMEAQASSLKDMRDQILTAADAQGNFASKEAAYDPMFQELEQMVKDQRITPDQAAKVLRETSEAKATGPDLVPTHQMTQWKTDVRDALPSSTWDEISTRNPTLANKIKNSTGSGMRAEVERAADEALKGVKPNAGTGELADLNATLGDLINPRVQQASTMMSNAYEKKPWVSTADLYAALFGMGIGASSHHTVETGLATLLGKKALEASQSTSLKTGLGVLGDKAMKSAVVAPALDAATKRVIINKISPYEKRP